MKKIIELAGCSILLGASLLLGGCGEDNHDPVATQTTPMAVTVAPGGATATTTTQVIAKTSTGADAITIPAGTVITPTGGTFTSTTVPITVSTPLVGAAAVPAPSTAGLIVDSLAGAVDVSVGGFSTVSFSNPVTIKIPVDPAKVSNPPQVYMNKNDGNGYILLAPTAVSYVPGSTTVTVTTSNLCWFVVDPTFTSSTGGTGGTGGTGTGTGI